MAPLSLSRTDLLSWINSQCGLSYSKVEQCGQGSAYCLLFNKLYPQSFNINKVHLNPKNEAEIMHNYKILQFGFTKRGVTREINVERLMKCRLQDNLEFVQWFAQQWLEIIGDIQTSNGEIIATQNDRSSSRRSSLRPPVVGNSRTPSVSSPKQPVTSRQPSNVTRRVSSHSATPSRVSSGARSAVAAPPRDYAHIQHVANLESQINELQNQLQELTLERERDIELIQAVTIEKEVFLSKLRRVEFLCEDEQESPRQNITALHLAGEILDILCEPVEGFAPVDQLEDGDEIVNDENVDVNHHNEQTIDQSMMKTPKSDSLMDIIPDYHTGDQQINSNTNAGINAIVDDDETF